MIENTETTPTTKTSIWDSKLFKCIPCFFITLIECAVLTGLVYGIIEIFKLGHKNLGLVIISVLCFLGMACWSLISWKKRRDKRNDSIEKEG